MGFAAIEREVLLVDEDDATSETLRDWLQEHYDGMVVETCADGAAAQSRIAAANYDVVISDIRTPHMDNLAHLARTRRLRRRTPILLATWRDEHGLSVQALRGGVYDFIHKPVDNGVRVCTVLVSPLIKQGIVFRPSSVRRVSFVGPHVTHQNGQQAFGPGEPHQP